jgi:hypothetical protein
MGQYAAGQTAQDLLNSLKSNVSSVSPAPVLKDTIAVPSGGYAIIKFRPKNPGKLSLSLHFFVVLLFRVRFTTYIIGAVEFN